MVTVVVKLVMVQVFIVRDARNSDGGGCSGDGSARGIA